MGYIVIEDDAGGGSSKGEQAAEPVNRTAVAAGKPEADASGTAAADGVSLAGKIELAHDGPGAQRVDQGGHTGPP